MGTVKKKYKTIGDQIREALITQKKLAKLTGINEVRLSRGMRDELKFTPEEIASIEFALQIKIEQ